MGRCEGFTISGRECRNRARSGQDFCHHHLGRPLPRLENPGLGAGIEALRALLAQEAHPGLWEQLVERFASWMESPEREVALEYARQHLAQWPDALFAEIDTLAYEYHARHQLEFDEDAYLSFAQLSASLELLEGRFDPRREWLATLSLSTRTESFEDSHERYLYQEYHVPTDAPLALAERLSVEWLWALGWEDAGVTAPLPAVALGPAERITPDELRQRYLRLHTPDRYLGEAFSGLRRSQRRAHQQRLQRAFEAATQGVEYWVLYPVRVDDHNPQARDMLGCCGWGAWVWGAEGRYHLLHLYRWC